MPLGTDRQCGGINKTRNDQCKRNKRASNDDVSWIWFCYTLLRKKSVHSHWVPKEAIGGVREFYDEEQGLLITHYFQKFPSPVGSDAGDSDKENVPPEHSYKETNKSVAIRYWQHNVHRSGTPESPPQMLMEPSPMEGIRVPYDQVIPGQLSQSFCDTLPDYPEGHFITVHRKWMHAMANQIGASHGPYCICRNKAQYENRVCRGDKKRLLLPLSS